MGTAVAKQETVYDIFQRDTFKREIARALPKHLTPDRMLRIALTSVRQTPLLQRCTPQSLMSAIMDASQLGLEPNGIVGHAYLIPYKNKRKGVYEAQLQIGYRGYLELARRSGQVSTLYAYPVFENDRYEYKLGLNRTLDHVPARFDRGGVIAAYAVVQYKDGGFDFEWMWREQIESVKGMSQSARLSDSPWQSHYEEMARKTTIRRLAKRLPLSPEFQRAAIADDYLDQGLSASYMEGDSRKIEKESEPTLAKVQDLNARLMEKQGQEPELPGEDGKEKSSYRSRRNPMLVNGAEVKTCGITGEVLEYVKEQRGLHPEIVHGCIQTAIKRSDVQEITFLREDEGLDLLNDIKAAIAAKEPPMRNETPSESAETGKTEYIHCPVTQTQKATSVCDQKCDKKDSCGNYEDHLKRQSPKLHTNECPNDGRPKLKQECEDCTDKKGCPEYDGHVKDRKC